MKKAGRRREKEGFSRGISRRSETRAGDRGLPGEISSRGNSPAKFPGKRDRERKAGSDERLPQNRKLPRAQQIQDALTLKLILKGGLHRVPENMAFLLAHQPGRAPLGDLPHRPGGLVLGERLARSRHRGEQRPRHAHEMKSVKTPRFYQNLVISVLALF